MKEGWMDVSIGQSQDYMICMMEWRSEFEYGVGVVILEM